MQRMSNPVYSWNFFSSDIRSGEEIGFWWHGTLYVNNSIRCFVHECNATNTIQSTALLLQHKRPSIYWKSLIKWNQRFTAVDKRFQHPPYRDNIFDQKKSLSFLVDESLLLFWSELFIFSYLAPAVRILWMTNHECRTWMNNSLRFDSVFDFPVHEIINSEQLKCFF